MAGMVLSPILLYSASTCLLMAMALAPAMPTDLTQFFVLILSSPLNALITFNFVFMVSVVVAQITSKMVFGTISDEETSIVKESARNFIMFKSVYVFSALHAAQFTDLFIWMTCFLIFGWLRAFVALAYHRLSHLDYQQQEFNQRRKKIFAFIIGCLVVDVSFMALLINVFSTAGWRPLLLLVHEGALTIIACACSIILYGFQVMDYRSSADHTQKAFYLDSAGEILVQTVSLIFLLQVWAAYGLSLTVVDMFFFMIVRAVYVRISARIASLIAYRRVLNDINIRFADATAEEIEALDDHCAICHEQLQLGVTKKLPCSHFFHLPCLRQWMKYRRTCPVCRSDLLNQDSSNRFSSTSRQPHPNQWGLRRLFHFNTGNWASWMPNISFEVVRGIHVAPVARRGLAQIPPIRILSDMFPNIPEDVLLRYLNQANGVLPIAIENLMIDNNIGDPANNGADDDPGPSGSPNNHNFEPSGVVSDGRLERSSEATAGVNNREVPDEPATFPIVETNGDSVDDRDIEVRTGSFEFNDGIVEFNDGAFGAIDGAIDSSNGETESSDGAIGSSEAIRSSSEEVQRSDHIPNPDESISNLRRRVPYTASLSDQERMARDGRSSDQQPPP